MNRYTVVVVVITTMRKRGYYNSSACSQGNADPLLQSTTFYRILHVVVGRTGIKWKLLLFVYVRHPRISVPYTAFLQSSNEEFPDSHKVSSRHDGQNGEWWARVLFNSCRFSVVTDIEQDCDDSLSVLLVCLSRCPSPTVYWLHANQTDRSATQMERVW